MIASGSFFGRFCHEKIYRKIWHSLDGENMARILIADDDPDYISAFSGAMEALGHETKGVNSGAELVPELQSGNYDLLFLDVMMPGGGAISLIHVARKISPDLPVVVITGSTAINFSPIFTDGMKHAHAKVSKTSSLKELGRIVESALATK